VKKRKRKNPYVHICEEKERKTYVDICEENRKRKEDDTYHPLTPPLSTR
jgi:hypothetical protein